MGFLARNSVPLEEAEEEEHLAGRAEGVELQGEGVELQGEGAGHQGEGAGHQEEGVEHQGEGVEHQGEGVELRVGQGEEGEHRQILELEEV